MKRTMMTWMLAGTLLATTAAACGSDDDKKDEKPASTEAVSEDNGGGESTGNADVDAYCQNAEEVAAQLKEVMADPSSSGKLQELLTKSQELATEAATLAASVAGDAAAAQKVNECSQALAAAATGA